MLEPGDVLRVARGLQVALEIVRPGVNGQVIIAYCPCLEQDMTAVHADVVVGPQAPILGTDDEHRLIDQGEGDVVAGFP